VKDAVKTAAVFGAGIYVSNMVVPSILGALKDKDGKSIIPASLQLIVSSLVAGFVVAQVVKVLKPAVAAA